uniref:Uncharacterized protein n=1 Tax=Anguilla anguilla TaxID=7936 RepID=A0A0E9QZE5_ANGAN
MNVHVVLLMELCTSYEEPVFLFCSGIFR